jgi:hypothetical protein
VSRNDDLGLYWSAWINTLRSIGIVFAPQSLPVSRFESTISHELEGALNYVFPGMTAVYLSIFMCGWNIKFPTHTELLWRAASLMLVVTLVAHWAVKFLHSVYN